LSGITWGGEGVLNPAIICCDRHCGADRTALTWVGQDGASKVFTFEQLKDLSGRFANVLRRHGVGPNDRVAGLLPRTPELLITILGVWRVGGVYQPLFTAFGPRAIEHRLSTSGAKVVVTDAQNRAKLDDIVGTAKIATVSGDCAVERPADIDFARELEASSPQFVPVARALSDPFLAMFTSGTSGPAKPLSVPIRAIAAFMGYMRDAAGLKLADPYWNIADPGWAYGLYYGSVGPRCYSTVRLPSNLWSALSLSMGLLTLPAPQQPFARSSPPGRARCEKSRDGYGRSAAPENH